MGNGVVDVADPLDAVGHAKRGGQPFQPIPLAAVAVPTNEAEPGRGIRHPRQRGDRDILSLLLAETPGADQQGCSGLAVGEHPVGMEVGTVDPVRDHAHTVRGPPQHAMSLFRLFLRHGDDRVAERGEGPLDPPVQGSPPAPDQPRPVVGRDDHPGASPPQRDRRHTAERRGLRRVQVHHVTPSGEPADRDQVREVPRRRLASQVHRHVVGSGAFDPARQWPRVMARARDRHDVARGDGRLGQLPHAHGHAVGHRLRHDEDVEACVVCHSATVQAHRHIPVLRTVALGYVEGRMRATVADGRHVRAANLRSA